MRRRVEALQLVGLDHLERGMAAFMKMSSRITYIMYLGRCTEVLAEISCDKDGVTGPAF